MPQMASSVESPLIVSFLKSFEMNAIKLMLRLIESRMVRPLPEISVRSRMSEDLSFRNVVRCLPGELSKCKLAYKNVKLSFQLQYRSLTFTKTVLTGTFSAIFFISISHFHLSSL